MNEKNSVSNEIELLTFSIQNNNNNIEVPSIVMGSEVKEVRFLPKLYYPLDKNAGNQSLASEYNELIKTTKILEGETFEEWRKSYASEISQQEKTMGHTLFFTDGNNTLSFYSTPFRDTPGLYYIERKNLSYNFIKQQCDILKNFILQSEVANTRLFYSISFPVIIFIDDSRAGIRFDKFKNIFERNIEKIYDDICNCIREDIFTKVELIKKIDGCISRNIGQICDERHRHNNAYKNKVKSLFQAYRQMQEDIVKQPLDKIIEYFKEMYLPIFLNLFKQHVDTSKDDLSGAIRYGARMFKNKIYSQEEDFPISYKIFLADIKKIWPEYEPSAMGNSSNEIDESVNSWSFGK